MTGIVLDASAVLALLKQEVGAELVLPLLHDAVMSAVNYAEVVSYFIHAGRSPVQVEAIMREISLTIVPANERMAVEAGQLRAVTASAGLSLADRFCLALALSEKRAALTANRQWQSIAEAVGVEIILIR